MPKHNKKLIFFIDLLEILILIKNIYTVFSNHFTYVDFNRTIQRTQFGYQPLQSYTFFSWMSQTIKKCFLRLDIVDYQKVFFVVNLINYQKVFFIIQNLNQYIKKNKINTIYY